MAVRVTHGEHSCCPAAWFNEVPKVCGQGSCPLVTMETGQALRAGVGSMEIKMNQLMAQSSGGRRWPSRGGSSVRIISPSCSFLQTNSRTETQTPPGLFSGHTVLPHSESKRTYTSRISKLEMPEYFCSFRSLLIGDLLFYLKRHKQLYNPPQHFPSSNVGLFDFIQSQTHLRRKLCFNE